MTYDWSTLKKPTPAEMRATWKDLNDLLARKRRAALDADDADKRRKANDPCPYWSDGVHCYAQGIVQTGGAFVSDVPPHVANSKQCKCGARIRPADYK